MLQDIICSGINTFMSIVSILILTFGYMVKKLTFNNNNDTLTVFILFLQLSEAQIMVIVSSNSTTINCKLKGDKTRLIYPKSTHFTAIAAHSQLTLFIIHGARNIGTSEAITFYF